MEIQSLKTVSRVRPLIRAALKPLVLAVLPALMLIYAVSSRCVITRDVSSQAELVSTVSSTSRDNAPTAVGVEAPPASSIQTSADTANGKAGVKFCDLPGDCIFDVGHNTGQDTDFYLRNPNTRVVAVEANPALVAISRKRFAREIAEGRLILLTLVLTDEGAEREDKVTFWVNSFDKFSSFIERRGCRDNNGQEVEEGDHTFCEKVEIEAKTCRELLEEYGTPVYLKIDIEGMDKACVESVGELDFSRRPKYMSVESVGTTPINRYLALGYNVFKAVNQRRLQSSAEPELRGYSGPWGEDAEDDDSGQEWVGAEEMLSRLPLPKTVKIGDMEKQVWYDLHAKKSVLPDQTR